MEFPKLSMQFLINSLEPPKSKVRIVFDTDTYSEVDDQFALVYAIKSSDKIEFEQHLDEKSWNWNISHRYSKKLH